MYVLTRLKKIKSKTPLTKEETEKDGIDYHFIHFFETEEEAIKKGSTDLEFQPHSTFLVFTLSKVIKKKESPTEIVDMLE